MHTRIPVKDPPKRISKIKVTSITKLRQSAGRMQFLCQFRGRGGKEINQWLFPEQMANQDKLPEFISKSVKPKPITLKIRVGRKGDDAISGP